MSISKKEKYLLGLLGTIFISVMYYQFIYTKQVEKLNVKRQSKNEVEERYNGVMKAIETLDSRKEKNKILNAEIVDKSKNFYPTILQEKIILELDKLLIDSGLSGNIAFSPIEVAPVSLLLAPNIAKGESSLKPITDSYKNIGNNGSSNEGDKKPTAEVPAKEQDTKKDQTGQVTNPGTNTGEATAEQLKVAINFSGTYEGLKKFILSIEEYSKKIAITNIAITPKSQTDVTGTMSLEFFAIPKLGDEDLEYLKWNLNNVYGKDVLFSEGAASGAYRNTVEEQASEGKESDFVMMLKTPTSELPTLTLGKAKDNNRESYVYSDNVKVEEVTVEFKEESGKLYYKYKTSEEFYPKEDTLLGKEFTANSNEINLEILSEKRLGNEDNSGVKLKVVNNSNKTVNIIVKDDDSKNPRVSVASEGNTVNVTKK